MSRPSHKPAVSVGVARLEKSQHASNALPRSTGASRPWIARTAFLIAGVLVVAGFFLPIDRYVTPERGMGYALGIIGGSMMLLLLIYPARKRARWLNVIGGVKRWFQIHMFLGVAGPLCILYHADFSTGATNSNVALWSMIIVASSGLVGRFFYARIHEGLHGQRATLAELSEAAERLKSQTQSIAFMPELMRRAAESEQRMTRFNAVQSLWFMRPWVLQWRCWLERRRLHQYVRTALQAGARASDVIAAHKSRLRRVAFEYVDRRLLAARRVAELESFERLFSWWHVLHLPLFFMLLIAGIVHVVAVHVY